MAVILVCVFLLAFGVWLLKTPHGQRALHKLLHLRDANATSSTSAVQAKSAAIEDVGESAVQANSAATEDVGETRA